MSFDGNDDPSSTQPVSNNPEATPDAKHRPVSARKLAANRANAAQSTGPRTPEGKARVSMNAVRHGLASHAAVLPGENAEELNALGQAYQDDLRPRGELERDLVARIVGIAWRLRRVARAEEAMWNEQDVRTLIETDRRLQDAEWLDKPLDDVDIPPRRSGVEFIACQFLDAAGVSPIERLAIYEQRLSRSMHAAIRELNLLRKLRGPCNDEQGNEEGNARENPERVTKTQVTDNAVSDDAQSAQNKPTEPPASSDTEAPGDVPTDTGGDIVQNKPTAGPPTSVGAVLPSIIDPFPEPPVDAPDARPHPPSP